MRWKVESTPVPFPSDTRIREHFLFRPKVIKKECRWLEKAKYKQCFESYCMDWVDIEWIDEEKRK